MKRSSSGEFPLEIFISAGEASGDLHGSHLARAIKSIAPLASISCLGGPRMRAEGIPVVVDHRSMSVVGVAELAGHIRAIYGAWRKIKAHLLATRPSVVVLIDFPDFNLFLGRFAKKIGAKVFYYISPQVWGWREGRVKTIRKLVDRMAVILPFEKEFYASHGIVVDYVGHPLVDIMADLPDKALCERLYRNSAGPFIGLLPGSRRNEVNLLLDILLDAARIISTSFPEARFIMPVAPSLDAGELESRASGWRLPLRVVPSDTYGVIRACDLILAASGTVTLEAAILETPMIIVYKLSRLSRRVGQLLIRVKMAGLPNLIAGRKIVPEFVEEEPTAPRVAECAIGLLSDPLLLDGARRELGQIHSRLGEPGISERVARLVVDTAEAG
jgi:lipid-A-disaccharide synthase